MPRGKNSRPVLELQDRDLAIFRGLFESRLMTLGHISQLYFDGRSEAAKKRIQNLKSARYLGERSRRVYEPSILHLRERAFIELSASGKISEYPRFTWKQLHKRLQVSDSTLRHELDVLKVKTSLSSALRVLPRYELVGILHLAAHLPVSRRSTTTTGNLSALQSAHTSGRVP